MNDKVVIAVLALILLVVGLGAAATGLFAAMPVKGLEFAMFFAALVCFAMAAFVLVKGPSIVAGTKSR